MGSPAWFGLSLLLIAAGCVSPAGSRTAEGEPAADTAPITVTVAPVTARPAQRVLKFVGTLFGAEEVTLSSQVEGQIDSLHGDLGDRVEPGQILAKIDDEQLRARLRVLEANVAKAQADEARTERLVGQKVVSQQEYEAVATRAAVAVAERDQVAVLLRHTAVRSPLRGSIARRLVSEGEYVRAGAALFELVADDSLVLRGELPERFATELAVDQVVHVGVEAHAQTLFSGRLTRISPAVDPQSRSIRIEALVENLDHRLKPGFFASASLITRRDDQALLVPEQAVISFAGITKVFIVRDNVAHQTPVRAGPRSSDGMVEILEGVYPDELVVTSGFGKLEDGAVVTVGAPS